MTADVGQEDDLNGVDEKALRTGATKAYIEDLREEFAKDFIFPMLRSGALYEGRYLLGTSVARPLITKRLVEIARAEGADALAHGATGKGNDQVRFQLSAAALAPDLRVIAPWREWDLMSRTALNFFAEQHNIPISSGAKHYSMGTTTCSIAASKAASLKIRGKNPSKPLISWPSRSRRPLMKPNTSPSPSNTATRSR